MSKVSDEVKARLQKQIEFYFGDSNSKDKWLRSKLKEDAEEYLPLATLLSFNRVKEICMENDVLLEVCERSDKLQVSEDKLKVKRSTPWPEQDTSRPRTVFVNHMPPAASLDEMLAFFAQYGEVNAVRFRRNEDRSRKDSVFVEFAQTETAEKVAGLKEADYTDGTKLSYESNEDYTNRERANRNNRNNGNRKRRDDGNDVEEKKLFEPGTVVHFTGIGTHLSRQALKEVFESHVSVPGSVKSVDYVHGGSEGYVRLENEIVASFLVEKLRNDKIQIDKEVPEVRVLEGKEFDGYLEKVTLIEGIKGAPQKRHKQKQKRGGGKEKRKEKNAHQTNE